MRLKTKGMIAAGLGSLAIKAAYAAYRWRAGKQYSFHERVILLTGGSRGLGLVLARQLISEGAKLTIVARDGAELERATADLKTLGPHGSEVLAVKGDIGERSIAEAAVRQTVERFGGLDVVINNAGIIQTGPYEHMQLADFEAAMATHFYGPLYTTLAALPYLRERKGARIVNIASIGGKLAIPHLLPYCASKFALTGFSSGLRAELAREKIAVTTVCPGLMRTGSHLRALFKGKQSEEYFWFALSDSLPLITVTATEAAEQILSACRRGDAELIIGAPYRVAALLTPLVPELVSSALSLMNRLMPGTTGPEGNKSKPGYESRAQTPSVLTYLADREAKKNNELPN